MLSARDDGRLVGVAFQGHPKGAPAESFVQVVAVDEQHVGRGLGTSLLRRLDAALPPQARHTMGMVDDADEQAIIALARWGFKLLQLSINSRLDLAEATEDPLPPGITVDVSPGLTFPDGRAVELMLDRSQTNPEREYDGPTTRAQLRHLTVPGGATSPLGLVLRVDGRPAAISFALLNGEVCQVWYTGVDPSLRGRGLARLAKQQLHRLAREAGATYAVTNNEEHNVGIRHVNESLGYRKTSGAYWARRDL
jgi:GNAT superfamily N-acetyltransferase